MCCSLSTMRRTPLNDCVDSSNDRRSKQWTPYTCGFQCPRNYAKRAVSTSGSWWLVLAIDLPAVSLWLSAMEFALRFPGDFW